MLQGLLWCDALLWVKGHHLVHQVDCLLACIWNQLAQRGGHELWEGEANFSRQLIALWPLSLSWATQDSACLIDLISLVVTWEEWSQQIQLGHDCTESENIYWTIVIGAS